jgi:hypothetical protein
MGNNISSTHRELDDPHYNDPLTGMPHLERRCMADLFDDDGDFDMNEYYSQLRNRRRIKAEKDEELDEVIKKCMESADAESESDGLPAVAERKRRSKKREALRCRTPEGDLIPLTWNLTTWYTNYILSPNLDSPTFHEKFRRRFRMPYDAFLNLREKCEASGLFSRWMKKKRRRRECADLGLMLLGALRYIGRGWTFDDIEEATAISEETHRRFLHVFLQWGDSTFFYEQVVMPNNKEEAKKHMGEMSQAGFHGSVGSSDATHVGMEKCSHWLAQAHSGPKLNMPSRTYNITTNHRRRILGTTTGHPARWNDKTL